MSDTVVMAVGAGMLASVVWLVWRVVRSSVGRSSDTGASFYFGDSSGNTSSTADCADSGNDSGGCDAGSGDGGGGD